MRAPFRNKKHKTMSLRESRLNEKFLKFKFSIKDCSVKISKIDIRNVENYYKRKFSLKDCFVKLNKIDVSDFLHKKTKRKYLKKKQAGTRQIRGEQLRRADQKRNIKSEDTIEFEEEIASKPFQLEIKTLDGEIELREHFDKLNITEFTVEDMKAKRNPNYECEKMTRFIEQYVYVKLKKFFTQSYIDFLNLDFQFTDDHYKLFKNGDLSEEEKMTIRRLHSKALLDTEFERLKKMFDEKDITEFTLDDMVKELNSDPYYRCNYIGNSIRNYVSQRLYFYFEQKKLSNTFRILRDEDFECFKGNKLTNSEKIYIKQKHKEALIKGNYNRLKQMQKRVKFFPNISQSELAMRITQTHDHYYFKSLMNLFVLDKFASQLRRNNQLVSLGKLRAEHFELQSSMSKFSISKFLPLTAEETADVQKMFIKCCIANEYERKASRNFNQHMRVRNMISSCSSEVRNDENLKKKFLVAALEYILEKIVERGMEKGMGTLLFHFPVNHYESEYQEPINYFLYTKPCLVDNSLMKKRCTISIKRDAIIEALEKHQIVKVSGPPWKLIVVRDIEDELDTSFSDEDDIDLNEETIPKKRESNSENTFFNDDDDVCYPLFGENTKDKPASRLEESGRAVYMGAECMEITLDMDEIEAFEKSEVSANRLEDEILFQGLFYSSHTSDESYEDSNVNVDSDIVIFYNDSLIV